MGELDNMCVFTSQIISLTHHSVRQSFRCPVSQSNGSFVRSSVSQSAESVSESDIPSESQQVQSICLFVSQLMRQLQVRQSVVTSYNECPDS